MSNPMSAWLGAALLGLMSVGASFPAQAHHSHAMFDKNKVVTVNGVVSKIDWGNPHVYFFVEVADGSATKQYSIECGGPHELASVGWKMNTLKVGDKITVSLYPLRDGRLGGLVDRLTLPSGVVIKAV